MGFVFIFRRRAQAGRAGRLVKALRQRGVDACAGLDHEPDALRVTIGRRLVDESALTLAVWLQADLADENYLDIATYAGSQRKLVQASAEPGPPARAFAGAPFAPEHWLSNEAAFADWCDQLAEYVQASPPSVWPYPIAEEYSALSEMHKRGGVEAIARFLREHPGGLFEDIVRAELDDATRPVYRPSSLASDPDNPSPVWRLRSFPAAPWLGVAGVVAAAALVAVLARPDANRPTPAIQEAERSEPFAAPTDSLLSPPAAAALELRPLTEAEQYPTRVDAAFEAVADDRESTREIQTPPSVVSTPQTITPPPSEQSIVRDISGLSPGLRAIVEQARRAQARALTEARREGNGDVMPIAARGGSGLYLGQRSDGGADGAGRAAWANGDVYTGTWAAARPNGPGVLDLANGARFEGEFSDGAPTGRGVFWDADGNRLTGDRLFAELVRARTHD